LAKTPFLFKPNRYVKTLIIRHFCISLFTNPGQQSIASNICGNFSKKIRNRLSLQLKIVSLQHIIVFVIHYVYLKNKIYYA